MKDKLTLLFLAHLLKKHESEDFTSELVDRLTKAAMLAARTALQSFPERKPYQK